MTTHLTFFLGCLLATMTLGAQERYNLELLANVNFLSSGERGNDVWGYTDANGLEYAIMGSTQAAYIYSLEDPAAPVLRARIPGVTSTWRDIKDYGDFLYVVEDTAPQGSGDGILAIDMSQAPTTITHSFYKPNVTVGGTTQQLQRSHNLYITDDGLLVLAGSNLYSGAPLFFDLKQDPREPPFVGASRRVYAHDVYANNGKLYSSDINAGQLTVHSYTDGTDVTALGDVRTSFVFTHNAWPTDDDSHVFTTDEVAGAFVDAFDVTDATDPRFVDRFRPDDTYETQSIPHNTHVTSDNYLVTSWYRDGVVVTDAARPHNLVEVGRYDTYDPEPNSRGFEGMWGAYPLLPSGLVLGSDIETGLYVFRPTYERGCYFEGQVVDSISRQTLSGVSIDFNGLAAQSTQTNFTGDFATGIYEEGDYTVTFRREGYETKTLTVQMSRGVLNFQEIELAPLGSGLLTVSVVDEQGVMIDGAETAIRIVEEEGSMRTYEITAARWGFLTGSTRVEANTSAATRVELVLSEGIFDDFTFDLGWDIVADAATGNFERAVPIGTSSGGLPVQLATDVLFDFGGEAFVTQNLAGDAPAGDVDNGTTSITSPPFDLTGMDEATLQFYYYFYNAGGTGTPNDALTVRISNGTEAVTVATLSNTVQDWTLYSSEVISSLITLTDNMTVTFETSDLPGSGHLVEAMVDAFSITTGEAPEINFAETEGCAPFAVPLSGPDGTRWTLTGAATLQSNGAIPDFALTEPGEYTLTVLASDGVSGLTTDVYENAFTVLTPVAADFRIEQLQDTVFFFNQSTGASSITWDFGDGTTSTELFPFHVYDQPATYSVTVIAEGDCGTDSLSRDVTVTTSGTVPTLAEMGLSVVGNPVSATLDLRYEGEASINLELVSVHGQVLLSPKPVAPGRTSISVQQLPAGQYFLRASGSTSSALPITIVR